MVLTVGGVDVANCYSRSLWLFGADDRSWCKRCLCIRAGLNRREASSIVAGGGNTCTGDQLYVHRAKQSQKIVPQSGITNHNPSTRTNVMTRFTPRGTCAVR